MLNAREMKQARKDIFFGRITEPQWGSADKLQTVILHHIDLMTSSLTENPEDLEELINTLIEWKEVKQLENY